MVYPNSEHPPTRDGLALASIVLGALALFTSIFTILSFILAFIGLLLGVASLLNYHNTLSKIAVGLNSIAIILAIIITFSGCTALIHTLSSL